MSDPDQGSEIPSDRTVIMPSPGKRRDMEMAQAISPLPSGDTVSDIGAVIQDATHAYTSPLLAAAAPLLAATARIRETPRHDDPPGLRQALAEALRQFESRARAAGGAPEKVLAARYLLCTLLDEAAADTPWGGSGVWARQSLLVLFHNETWGGEKCFQLLGKLAENPSGNRDLLELFHVCLALGFQGRYRVIEGGMAQLASVRERLWNMLQNQRGSQERDLSPHWRVEAPSRRMSERIPAWVVAGIAVLGLALVYMGLMLSLNSVSDSAFAAIQGLRVKPPSYPAPAAPVAAVPVPAPTPPRLATFLEPEIRAGLVVVADYPDRSVITLRGDGFFEPGSADVADKARPLLVRIAEALKSVPGAVVISGHSDNQPIRSVRFPSNWHLSRARAQMVQSLLAELVPAARMQAEGKSDSEPVAPNDTPEGRAKNRRVEIVLYPSPVAVATDAAPAAR